MSSAENEAEKGEKEEEPNGDGHTFECLGIRLLSSVVHNLPHLVLIITLLLSFLYFLIKK